MNKIFILFVSAIILSFPSITFAKAVLHTGGGETVITSAGKGVVRITPSGAYLDVSITVSSMSHKAAYGKLIKDVSAITSHFRKLPYLKSINTLYINVSLNRVYKGGEWVDEGYNAGEDLTLKISGNKNTNSSILFLLKHKSVKVNGVSPYFINLKKYKDKAIRLAYFNAITKAKAILALLKVKSFIIKKINIESAPAVFHPMMAAQNFLRSTSVATMPAKVYFYKKGKITEDVSIEIMFRSAHLPSGI